MGDVLIRTAGILAIAVYVELPRAGTRRGELGERTGKCSHRGKIKAIRIMARNAFLSTLFLSPQNHRSLRGKAAAHANRRG